MKYLVIFLFVGLGGLYAFNLLDDEQSNQVRPLSQLEQAGEKCSGIRDRATADIVPIVEFQKLELESRRANVLSNCMRDHGYIENPVWVSHVAPLAKKNASASNISQDEALEQLRRAEMQNFIPSSEVSFWLVSKPPVQAE